MGEIILLRHGESTGVQLRRLQGHSDLRLTERGRAQIRTLQTNWRQHGQTFAGSSPPAAARPGDGRDHRRCVGPSTPVEEPAVIEANLAREKGSPWSSWGLVSRSPGADGFRTDYDTGESEWAVHLRAGRPLAGLVELPEGNYLCVSHAT
jgi:broad specificity phosphatase PhoE